MALALALIAGALVREALLLPISWTGVGPGSGFFPFWLAVGVTLCGVIIFLRSLRPARAGADPPHEPFIPPTAWKPLLIAFLPMVAVIALIGYLGIYIGGDEFRLNQNIKTYDEEPRVGFNFLAGPANVYFMQGWRKSHSTESAQLTWSQPERGDIVVLLAPAGNPRSDDLIKRVVAVAGDAVEIRGGGLVLNGKPVPRHRVEGPCSYQDRREGDGWREEPCVAFEEKLDRHGYLSYCAPDGPCGDVPPQVVPPGHVWLAGDHRDRSADSRVFGPVPVGRIKGRAWVALVSWGPSGPRWDRLLVSVKH